MAQPFASNLLSRFQKSSSIFKSAEQPTAPEISALPRVSLRGFGLLGDSLPNPDEVLKYEAGGKSYALYRTMLKKDAHLADALRTRVTAIEATDWKVSPFVDTANGAIKATPEAEAHADYIKKMFETDNGNKIRRLISISYRDSLAFGFSVDESIFSYDAEAGKFTIKKFKPRKLERFDFNEDWEIRLLGNFFDKFIVQELDQWRFVVFRNGGGAENPYGDALCQELYWLFYFKKEIIKFWAVYLERFGTPILDIEYQGDVRQNKELKSAIDEVLDNYINSTGVSHNEQVKISLLEAKRSGEGTYDSFIRWADKQLSKSILGQTLSTDEGERSGSLALSKTHQSVADSVLARDCHSIASAINQQIIRPVVNLNWANVPGYPTISFDCDPPEDLKAKAETWAILQGMGVKIPAEFAQEGFSIPAPVEGEEILEKPEPLPLPGLPGQPANGNGPAPNGNRPTRTPAQVSMAEKREGFLEFSVCGREPVRDISTRRTLSRYRKLTGPGVKFLHAPESRDPYAVSFSPSVSTTAAIEFMQANFADFAGKVPPVGTPRVGLTSTFHIHDPFRKRILGLFDRIRPDLPNLLETDAALLAAAQMLVRKHLPFDLDPDLASMNEEAIRFAIQSMASQLSLTITEDRFTRYVDKYLDQHAFRSKTISEITEGISEDVTSRLAARSREAVKAFGEGKLTLSEATTEITRQFDDLAEWKARQIAVSEVNNAANWASIQIVRDTGQDWQAWFMVDPISCQTCLEQAARNPYKLHEAEILGLPHPNCNDFWAFTFKGEAA